jgi:replicative DNA helicase
MATERVLPHNLDAERSVLGGILVDNALFDVAAGVLKAEDFFRDGHKVAWKAMQTLRDRSAPIDYLTLIEELRAHGDLERVDGPAYVSALTDGVPHGLNVEDYAQIVRGKATLRAVIFASNQSVAEAYAAADAPEVIIDRAEERLFAVGKDSVRGDFVLADDWMRETHQRIDKAASAKRVVTGVPSGFPQLDQMTRGWQPSDLIYLGARPSSGKTSLALQLALTAAAHTMTGIISVEMSRAVIGMRAVALDAQVDAFRLMTGHLSDFELRRTAAAMDRIAGLRLAIDDAVGATSTQLRAKVRRFAARYGLGVVFIDYMQLLHDGGKAENRNHELSKISAGLKGLARELDIPVFVLSQLSRDSAKGSRRPQLSDLRDSGSLEQDADVVLLLHRPGQHHEAGQARDDNEAELIIAKQRNGPTGPIKLQWIGEQMRFQSAA